MALIQKISLTQKIASIRGIAEGIRTMDLPVGMPIPEATKLVNLATQATLDFTTTANKVSQAMPEIEDRVLAALRVVQLDFQRIIKNRLIPGIQLAKSKGQANVNGPIITANISLLLFSIAGGYEALLFFENIRPGFLDLIPNSAMRVMVDIAEAVAAVAKILSKAFKDAFNIAKKASWGFLEILKWGTIAGGLYLLYGAMKQE